MNIKKTEVNFIKIIKFEDESYPKKLRNIDNPPKQLYVLGDEKILENKGIAIVGSRNCTEYGRKYGEFFSSKLTNYGMQIISGLATGIDTCAHIGCLKEGGKTIAVLGSGFNYIFPEENISLANEIIEKGGAVISEYSPETKKKSDYFRNRNRIVSGLSEGVLVVEAKNRSGTSITAKFAKEQEKEIFCIPVGLDNKCGLGTNKLIQGGAKLVIHPYEIITNTKIKNTKNQIIEKEICEYKKRFEELEKKENINIKEEYRIVYEILGKNPININEICKRTNKEISEVSFILTMLELDGYVEELYGKEFKKIIF